MSALLTLITGVSALAQETEAPEKPKRAVRILYFQSPKGAPSKAQLHAGTQLVAEVELPRHNFTESVEIPEGAVRLNFLPRVLAEGEELPKETPSVAIAEDWKKVLLLVFENEKNEVLPIQVKAINASDNAFGPGSVYFANFSEIRVGGTVGDKKLDLKPQSFEILESPVQEDGFYPTQLFSINKKGEQPRRFIKQMWEHNKSDRQLLFIIPQPAPIFATYYCAPIKDF